MKTVIKTNTYEVIKKIVDDIKPLTCDAVMEDPRYRKIKRSFNDCEKKYHEIIINGIIEGLSLIDIYDVIEKDNNPDKKENELMKFINDIEESTKKMVESEPIEIIIGDIIDDKINDSNKNEDDKNKTPESVVDDKPEDKPNTSNKTKEDKSMSSKKEEKVEDVPDTSNDTKGDKPELPESVVDDKPEDKSNTSNKSDENKNDTHEKEEKDEKPVSKKPLHKLMEESNNDFNVMVSYYMDIDYGVDYEQKIKEDTIKEYEDAGHTVYVHGHLPLPKYLFEINERIIAYKEAMKAKLAS